MPQAIGRGPFGTGGGRDKKDYPDLVHVLDAEGPSANRAGGRHFRVTFGLAPYVAALATLCTACSRHAEWTALPEQRKPLPLHRGTMVSMDDRDFDDYEPRDIAPAVKGIFWRWSYDRPELSIWVNQAAGIKCAADFGIVAETFKTTGPVTVTIFVNQRVAALKRYAKPGDYHLEGPVPPEWIHAPGIATIALEARPIWVAPTDHQHLGIVLVRAGFL